MSESYPLEELLQRKHLFRIKYFQATAQVLRKVLSTYVKEKDEAVEIGSGIGALLDHVPEYTQQILQTDISKEIIFANKLFHPLATSQLADVNNLPFSNESFDVVVGLSALSYLDDLKLPLEEISRVLRPGGYCIHFLDHFAAINNNMSQGNALDVLIPYAQEIQGNAIVTGMRYFSVFEAHENIILASLNGNIDPQVIEELTTYALNYFETGGLNFERAFKESANWETYLAMNLAIDELNPDSKPIIFNEYFQELIERELELIGFKTKVNEYQVGEAFVLSQETAPFNVYHNIAGVEINSKDTNLAKDQNKIISEVYTIVAQKPF